jgi:hypothetical protein
MSALAQSCDMPASYAIVTGLADLAANLFAQVIDAGFAFNRQLAAAPSTADIEDAHSRTNAGFD